MEYTDDENLIKKSTSNKFLKIMIFLTIIFSIINIIGIYEFCKILLLI